VSSVPNPALLPPTGASAAPHAPAQTSREQQVNGRPFADVLARETTGADSKGTDPLRFSKHALERVQRRGIPLDAATLGRLQNGVGRIAAKGARDSLVLVDGTAFVVSVNNRTVITAVGPEHMREHVFTNIDSAVIA